MRRYACVAWLASLCFMAGSTIQPFNYNQSVYDVDSVVNSRCKPGQSCYPSDADISAFGAELEGRVILSGMEDYANESHMYNTLVQANPRLVVMVQSKEDIQKTVLFAREHNLHVTIRSSGHDYAGRSTWAKSLNINLSEMKQYNINLSSTRHADGEIKVETGITWAEVYQLLDSHERCIVGGSAHTVAAGGYTLGGGHSPISRSLGYAVDNLLEVQVVLADGRIATCTETTTVIEEVNGTITTVNDGDLFWALRGGGGGTFGVVVYFVYKLHQMPTEMVKFDTWIPLKYTTYSLDISDTVFETLNELILSLPREWGGYYLMNNGKTTLTPAQTGLTYNLEIHGHVQLVMNKFAPWDGTEETVFAKIIELCTTHLISYEFSNKTSFWDYEKDIIDPEIIRVYLVGTFLQPDKVDVTLAAFYKKEFFETFTNGILLACTGIMVGGRTTEFSNDSTPLHPGYRTAISCLSCGVILSDPYLPLSQQSKWDNVLIPMADSFNTRLQKFGSGMYFNEPTNNNPTWKVDFWGKTHYKRLLEIKIRYDPENFFTCHHCVGSAKGQTSSAFGLNGAINRTIYVLWIFVAVFVKQMF